VGIAKREEISHLMMALVVMNLVVQALSCGTGAGIVESKRVECEMIVSS